MTRTSELFGRFSKGQIAVLRRLGTPVKIQDFLDYELDFNDDPSDTCLSPLGVLEKRKADCIEGAMLAAAAFLYHGKPALLLDLRADPTDDDHVIAPFRENGKWGAVAQSHFCGLRYRDPIYDTVSELAKSYFEFYYNDYGKKSLREFSEPMSVAGLDPRWLYGDDVLFVAEELDDLKHRRLFAKAAGKRLRKADSLLVEAELIGVSGRPLCRRRARPYSKLHLPPARRA